jgi:coatomer subunit beta'
MGVQSYALALSVVEYQTLVLRGDMDAAAELLEDIPEDQKNKIARFLEGQGEKDLALEVATDPEHRFDLALALGNLPIALEIARSADAEHRWKTVGDAALTAWDVKLALECFTHAKDLGSLLLLHTAMSNKEGLRSLATQAQESNLHNIAFSCLWQLADVDGCIDLLVETGRVAEAVLFAQTYKPSRATDLVGTWKESLEKENKSKVAKILGVPGDEELFPEWDEYLKLEKEGGTLVDVSEDAEDANGAAESEENGAEVETEA